MYIGRHAAMIRGLGVTRTLESERGCAQHAPMIGELRGNNSQGAIFPGTKELRELVRERGNQDRITFD
jgi:hypothetical protein